MKILLLEHPRTISPDRCNDIANTPLSSCLLSGYTAGMLKSKGHEVEIIEGHLDSLSYAEIEEIIEAYRPDILGAHMVYYWERHDELYKFLEKIKGSGIKHIFAYGYYPGFAYEEILERCDAIDSVIVGEVEITVSELADRISQRKPRDISGLAERTQSGVAFEMRSPVDDLDSLPFPARTKAMLGLPQVNLLGSRGCYGACAFCYINPFYGNGSKWRFRSPENIASEIDVVISDHGKREFYFTDPNFMGPGQKGQERARRIAALLKERNIKFGIEARVNDIHDNTISALVDAGLRHILIGLESGRDSSLKRMNKMTTVEQNERAVKILRRHGIEPNIGFIMFEPDSSLEDIRENFDFLMRNELLENLPVTANALYHHQIVLKGTPAFGRLHKEGRLRINPSGYEGTVSFANENVALLADIMRRITNFIFRKMSGIWSGKVLEPVGALKKYKKVNGLLIEIFDDVLGALQAGRPVGDAGQIADEAMQKIERILNVRIYDKKGQSI
jgi:radical SAM superfamily enzyme YgiQ (UPF0313 family)